MSVAARKASVPRPPDADKFAAYKARKSAQKEEDRAKLAAAFPHLFDSEALKMKAAKEKYAGMKAAGTPNKRKSSIVDENHENAAPSNGNPAPNSAKKLRVVKPPVTLSTTSKSSSSSIKSISSGQKNVAFGSVSAQPTAPATTNAPILTSTRKPFVVMPSFSLYGKQQSTQPSQQQQPQLQMKSKEGIEIEMEIMQSVPANPAAATCAQVEAPALQAEAAMEDAVTNSVEESPRVEMEAAPPAAAEPQPQPLQEQVKDVLEYMLETEEIDEKLFERLSRSSSSITASSVRRLSTARQSICGSVPLAEILSSAAATTTASEPPAQAVAVEEPIEDVAVLDTVRTILTNLRESSSFSTLVSDAGEVVHEAEEEEIDVEAVIDAAVQDLAEHQPAEVATAITPLATKTVSWSLHQEPAAATVTEAVLDAQQQPSTASAHSMEPCCTPSKLVRTPTRVETHPRALVLEEAMSRGLLAAEVLQSMTIGSHVKYVINLRTLPNNGDSSKCVRATLLKRYSEFRNFRNDLLSVLSDEQRSLITELPPRDRGEAEGSEAVGNVQALHAWLQNVLSHQSNIHKQYRDRIYAFISN